MTETTSLPWDILARYRLIEILALWEGRITASQLGTAFDIGRQQAQKMIRQYRKQAPANLIYDNSRKGFIPQDTFQPCYTLGKVEEYLHFLGSNTQLDSPFAGLGIGVANTESLPLPSRQLSPAVVRALVKAARQNERLEVNYASFRAPEGEDRIIVPHTLVFAAGRWHVRAFCEKHQDYRDFVLSRFRDIPEACGAMLGTHDQTHDQDWQTYVDVCLIPDQRLPEAERRLIEADYGMEAGRLVLNCRGPLVLYALLTIGVNPNHSEPEPRAQQIEIANRAELSEWIHW
ncbi:WYL domain-containing protein [Aidingimonas halophila]|uniref:Predicted DNA-binding transcriptional regulator YafY, contains an HTH and WYL domains n=1 Tax=Aidingimonas halophila TaxID=574349 RepID=A0A1H3FL43_9GAMM|nr:WYL domain-containing protein [Aidingimonas halophila]GHC37646.1 WYL domain-containing protein [Aidingimonas halophila]SDX91507.1 Predicted DNA-binding transcriptional regulator YafY, contains an HTH and WYL domains [Aidingimonas halophila]